MSRRRCPETSQRCRRADHSANPRLVVVERTLSARRASEALGDLADLPAERYGHRPLLGRVWELRHNLQAYDAAYVALAEALGAVLVTADRRLARCPGLTCQLEVVSKS